MLAPPPNRSVLATAWSLPDDMEMARSEIEALATAAGLVVSTSVSARTALVVAADPYSQSGKAKSAQKLGVRLVTEQVFLYLLDHKATRYGAAKSNWTVMNGNQNCLAQRLLSRKCWVCPRPKIRWRRSKLFAIPSQHGVKCSAIAATEARLNVLIHLPL